MSEVFVGEAPDFSVRDGNVHISADGSDLWCMALRTFRVAHERAERMLVEHDANVALVMPIRDHAARS